ncbi:hypothetical protein LPJ59_005839 [Coemansia sp. RSA 2399]|nr:hypothetical protein LPJ59_005839 [Coemansia sp. RSA 2399]
MSSGGLEEETQKRKARLQALRLARQASGSKAEDTPSSSSDKTAEQQQQQPTATTENNNHDTVEGLVDGMVETTLAERQLNMASSELDITTVAPRRANWDLKHDLQQRLENLRPRNDAAIADLIRKRIQESGDASDLAGAVEASARSSGLQNED